MRKKWKKDARVTAHIQPKQRHGKARPVPETELYNGNIRPRNVWRKFGKQGRSNKGRKVPVPK